MKKFLIISCFLIIGCSTLGLGSTKGKQFAIKVRHYVCNLDPAARAIAHNELAMNGIEVRVNCNFPIQPE